MNVYCKCGNSGSPSCLEERCSNCCENDACRRHSNGGPPTVPTPEKVRYLFYIDETAKRGTVKDEEYKEFCKIWTCKNSISEIKTVEERIRFNKIRIEQERKSLPSNEIRGREMNERNELIELRTIWDLKNSVPAIKHAEYMVRLKRHKGEIEKHAIPIKANQTRRRNIMYLNYKIEYREILELMEKNIRDRMRNEENKLFEDILKNKDDIQTLKKIEEWTRKKNILRKRDKFCIDILTNIGMFVQENDTLSLMDAFKIEDNKFPPFVKEYKRCGFNKIGIDTFRDYLAIKPDKKIAQVTVLSDYNLTKKDIENVEFKETTNPHYRCASMMKLFNERQIMVLCTNKIMAITR